MKGSTRRSCELGVRNWVLAALFAAVPLFALAQHKNSSPAPTPHASAPPHTSAPSTQQHSMPGVAPWESRLIQRVQEQWVLTAQAICRIRMATPMRRCMAEQLQTFMAERMPGTCTAVAVSLDDLQEMHNHFREQITRSMQELSKKQGTGGLPKAPDTGTQDGEVPAPAPDSSAAKALKDQQSDADKTETEVKREAASSGGGMH